jgi:glycosyltransferase involved in cell wall biosynthesis
MKLLFIDSVCPSPYTPYTLQTKGLGGTEATVTRVAEALADYFKEVTVMQKGRNGSDIAHKALYTPIKPHLMNEKHHATIVLRDPQVAINVRKYKKHEPIWLWLHDLVTPKMIPFMRQLGELDIGVICVSEWHKTQFVEMAKTVDMPKFPKVRRIYNPIDDALGIDRPPSVVDRNKLVFFSSPHKGLDYALKSFRNLRVFNPEFKLYIANPGYMESGAIEQEGVVNLGVLSASEVHKHVAESLCVFYPNHVFPETFGLVMAEANALGTPVITHPHGAAPEVLRSTYQMCDTRNPKALIDRVMLWYNEGRPKVKAVSDFRMCNVALDWAKVLGV